VTGISDRLAVTAAAYDTVSARYAEFVRGELDALPLDRAVLAAFAEHVRAGDGGLVADVGCGEGRVGGPGDLGHPGDELAAGPKEDVAGTLRLVGQGCHRKVSPLRAPGRHQAVHLHDGGPDLVIMDGHDWHGNGAKRCGASPLGAGHRRTRRTTRCSPTCCRDTVQAQPCALPCSF
jgi:hypothetical protein